MDAKRELEIRGIIDKNGKYMNEPCPYHSESQECAMCGGTGLIYIGTIVDREQLAQAILDAGFVRLGDVEIDKEKSRRLIKKKLKNYKGEVIHNFLAQAIAKDKPIRVKEGKK